MYVYDIPDRRTGAFGKLELELEVYGMNEWMNRIIFLDFVVLYFEFECECDMWVWYVSVICECDMWVWYVSVICEVFILGMSVGGLLSLGWDEWWCQGSSGMLCGCDVWCGSEKEWKGERGRELSIKYVIYFYFFWTELDWTGLEWSGVEWSGMDWTGMDWIGMEWIGCAIWVGIEKRWGREREGDGDGDGDGDGENGIWWCGIMVFKTGLGLEVAEHGRYWKIQT